MAAKIPLTPTRALSTHLPSPQTSHEPSPLHDLTPRLDELFSPHFGITDEALLSAHKAAIVTPTPLIRYSLEKQNTAGTHLVVVDVEGNEAGSWKEGKVAFAGGEELSEFEWPAIKSVKDVLREQVFVHRGVSYAWVTEAETPFQKGLFKIIEDETNGPTKREVARHGQRGANEREGLVVYDSSLVDELLVVLTLGAVLVAGDRFFQ